MSLEVRKIGQWVTVRLDDDGTPLTPYGDRMVEVEPGQWMDPLGVALNEALLDEATTMIDAAILRGAS